MVAEQSEELGLGARNVGILSAFAILLLATPVTSSESTHLVVASVENRIEQHDGDQCKDSLSSYMKMQRQKNGFSGVALVALGGSIIFEQAEGYANIEWGIENDINTKFPIASMGKTITALAVLRLSERGVLSLEDQACDYFETCPSQWKAVTIRHLLSHQSGIPTYMSVGAEEVIHRIPVTAQEILTTISSKPIKFLPGHGRNYSNSNYYLLGMILEKIAGKNYSSVIDEEVFKPIGMVSSGYNQASKIVAKRASGYVLRDDLLENVGYLDVSWAFAAGGFYSTAGDLFLLSKAMSDDEFLSAETKASMWDRSIGTLGLGWWLPPDEDGRRVVRAIGGIDGFGASLSWYPDHNVAVILLKNKTLAGGGVLPGTRDIPVDLANIVFGASNYSDFPAESNQAAMVSCK